MLKKLRVSLLTSVALAVTFSVAAQAQNLDANGSLPRATPESVGVSSDAIVDVIKALDEQIDRVDSIMVLRDGKVVAEAWRSPASPAEPHALYSLSKSFASTAIGFAVQEGKMTLDQKIVDYCPDDVPENVAENTTKATIRDLLTMSCGHEKEPRRPHNISAFYNLEGPLTTPDEPTWAQSFMRQPAPFEPGTHFCYNTVGTYMATVALEKATGENARDYLVPRLFEPLHIATPAWEKSPERFTKGGTGLFLTTEDIAKFGQFLLQKGRWNDKQLLNSEWIEEATSKQIDNGGLGYGFQFWRGKCNSYRADGMYGQFCVVFPDQNAVVVLTQDAKNPGQSLEILYDMLIPQMKDAPLAEDADAVARLREAEQSLQPKEGYSPSELRAYTIHNDLLGEDMRYIVYTPKGYLTSSASYPILYLLHGLTDDEKTWSSAEKGQMQRICDEYFAQHPDQKRVIVMPDARATWYRNAFDGPDQYEDFFFNTFIPTVEKQVRVKSDRESRAVAGLSMGGYGTLLYALRHSDMFSAAYAMSPAVMYGQNRAKRESVDSDETFERLRSYEEAYDVVELLSKVEDKKAVRFTIDCGDDDFCLPGALTFFQKARELEVPCELRVRDGVHYWDYWRVSLPQALDFISK